MKLTIPILLIISLVLAIAITYGTNIVFVTCFNNGTIGGWGCSYGFPVAWRTFGDALGNISTGAFCLDALFWLVTIAIILFATRYVAGKTKK